MSLNYPLSKDLALFAKTNFRNVWKPFGIKLDDRRRHMYVIGKTGMGKSTMLENMVVQDIKTGHGMALVDPHGDTVEKMLNYVPSHRINDVIYFNPADLDYPIAFNVLEEVSPEYRHLVASGLIAVFKKIWIDSWGPRLEYVLRNTILALLEYPGSTLLGVTRLLVDKKYRDKVVDKVTDPIVKAFWVGEFNTYSNQFRTEAISPIQNKVGQFLSSSIIRNIVGQPKSTIDMRQIMDNGKILLMNLAKGRIGEDNSSLLGAMLITKLQLAAMSRINIPEDERRDFFLYVDEFQNFATESFANILSEARKYHLNLVVAHQYIEQLDEKVQAAVFGNVGTMVVFRVGAADAEFLAKEFDPIFTETDLVNLTKYDIYLKLMIDGVASEPFSATTLPPLSGPEGHAKTVVQVCRERYTRPREQVEEKIWRWAGADGLFREMGEAENGRPNFSEQRSRPESNRPPATSLEPILPVPKEEPISLSEALGRKPVTFLQPKAALPSEQTRRATARPAAQRPPPTANHAPSLPTFAEGPHKPRLVRSEPPSSEQPTTAPRLPQSHSVKPGDVIRFSEDQPPR